MTEQETARSKALPPYVPFKTFQNFIETLQARGLPSRIDRSLMGSLSGTAQGNLVTALKFLALTKDDGSPTEYLTGLVSADEKTRKSAAALVVKNSYAFVFTGDFDLSKATSRHLIEVFANYGATGETLRKAVKFFVLFANYAGMSVSPYIQQRSKPGPKRGTTNVRTRRRPEENGGEEPETGSEARGSGTPTPPREWDKMLLDKFPAFDPNWPDEVKTKWFESFQDLMKKGTK